MEYLKSLTGDDVAIGLCLGLFIATVTAVALDMGYICLKRRVK